MKLERPELFSGRDIYWFLTLCLFLSSIALTFQYLDYRKLTAFDDASVYADVIHQYAKKNGEKSYQVLKLRTDKGVQFYTTGSQYLRDLHGYRLELLIWPKSLSYLGYLKGFFAYSTIVKVYPEKSAKIRLAESIAAEHENGRIGQIYGALFTALPMDKQLRSELSALGVSHLLAISGFHLGVLTFILFALIKPLYFPLQQRYFPYRHGRLDLFIVISLSLLAYLWFLDFVPSLIRAFGMMIVGFILYDRGIRLLSIQTLFIVVMLLVSLWPRLFFALGFWLSVGGVFFILLFLHYFSHWHKVWQFIMVHLWVYVMMLPAALWLFGGFGSYHPLSVLWSMLFILFYPLALAAHLIGYGSVFDDILSALLSLSAPAEVDIAGYVVFLQLILALAAVRYKKALLPLLAVVMAVFVDAVYQIA